MTVDFGDRKLRLIQEILRLSSEKSLIKIEQQIKIARESEENGEKFWSAIKPIRKSISLEEMIKEQAYTPIRKKQFYQKVAKLNIDEPLEELLSMLSK
ncbi:MAG: hypothetical protein KDD63_23145 [Bacteroidetes bacterium]|nr:hypothetical protein [Bacteroidota bacterium]MCB0855145.1 hypothetical protein [Bacteroidota bacterium]